MRDLLSLTQWLSPAFPVGGFAYSHGLDWAIAAGDVSNEADMFTWLCDTLEFGAGRSDAIMLGLAHRGVMAPEDLADLAAALAASKERWQETRAQGTAFAATTNAILNADLPALPLPIAVGVQARRLSLPTATVAALYLQGFAGNVTAIATRIVPLGQTAGQRVLAKAAPLIARLAEIASDATPEDLATSVFRGDLAAMQHETQDVRLFLS
ncbi:urease accessory protein UreF [Pseudoruegeria sp. SK021]|uniref:urease accessory protein UreF n=1 Tax=Pseudoruegeria sp. SK021 TaxID=1933035 RepID=UPI000A23BB57|nr:urease accessory UreF family protein [Pseudoruegeria sp. SK021]OSP56336.1 urease accessory protein UreF [Pseudoruegeria sp. SK021]